VALHPADEAGPYPPEVRHRIRRDVLTDYVFVARALNECGAGAVSIQHEYGIWGGRDGDYVLDFVRELRRPKVVALGAMIWPHVGARYRQIFVRVASQVAAPAGLSRRLTTVHG
jgi:hypothetical protein